MTCQNCGAQNEVGSTFCANCGANLFAANNSNQVNSEQIEIVENNTPSVDNNQIINNFNTVNSNMNNFNNNKESFATKVVDFLKNKWYFVAIAVVALASGAVVFNTVFKDHKDGQTLDEALTASNSFFIRNNEGSYALFDVDGKQLTDFMFKSKGEFVNGAAKVSNSDNKNGVVSTSGKMVVDFGACKNLEQLGAYYTCTDENSKRSLLDAKGKVVLSNEDYSYSVFSGEHKYIFVTDKKNNKIMVYDFKGNNILTMDKSSDSSVKSPSGNSNDNYISIFYNMKNYIIDLNTGKTVISFSDEEHYCVDKINENDSNKLILSTCAGMLSTPKKHAHKYVVNGKEVFERTLESSGNMYFKGDNIELTNSYNYLLDDKGEDEFIVNNVIYKDYKNYIKETDGIMNGADLYVNGNLKEHINCDTVQGGYAPSGVYLLKNCRDTGDKEMRFINADGSKLNDKVYKRASEFDKNGYSSVSDDGNTYYLINTKGEKVSADYKNNNSADKINNVEGSKTIYRGTGLDGKSTIFEVNGDVIVTGDRISTQRYPASNAIYAIAENDGKYTLVDLVNKKEIITLDKSIALNEKYFTISNDGKTQYYSYKTGKMFYEA